MMEGLAELLAARGVTRLEPLGSGLEFSVFRGRMGGAEVAVRVAGRRCDSNANDPLVDTRALLVQERRLARFVLARGLPAAAPLDLILSSSPDVPDSLVSAYVPDDGSPLDPYRLGGVLARLHALAPPGPPLVAAEGMPAARLLVRRVLRRWAEVGRLRQDWPAAPPGSVLAAAAAALGEGSLLHLDVRRPNVRCRAGEVSALLDWSNALRGDPVLEFGRLGEYARLPDNGLDLDALRAGYGEPPPDGDAPALLCRLDAALMLALVFLSEAPDAARGDAAADRVLELYERLGPQAPG
ncbi:phosphotransferase [Nonomuraea phyllanthi]|uniref:phosphotransferase family protein n=1 Tax=Nonomuraea phyllanthi TaxID=2219224 RepID=UPI00129374DC|nr:aminoglycoside phosphotransferase family protein [Nonomuraea phyllanthi]QFY13521.1 phosphotransferase [Nonomuraea phyllanthi]